MAERLMFEPPTPARKSPSCEPPVYDGSSTVAGSFGNGMIGPYTLYGLPPPATLGFALITCGAKLDAASGDLLPNTCGFLDRKLAALVPSPANRLTSGFGWPATEERSWSTKFCA